MLIAHLPVGYVIGRVASQRFGTLPRSQWAAVLVGSVIPDIDMLWFWSADHRQHNHHSYFTHWPAFWLFVWLAGLTIRHWRPASLSAVGLHLFALGTLSHMVMDSIAAPIMWFQPFSGRWVEMVHVPASPHGSLYALMTHWTFGLELFICAIAVAWFGFDRIARRFRDI